MTERTEHHLFCNGDPRAPVTGCRWCDPTGGETTGLWASYPYETAEEAQGLVGKHFPDARVISAPHIPESQL